MSRRAVACAASICVMLSLLIAGEAGAFPGSNHRTVGQYRNHNQSSNRSFAGRQTLARPPGRPSRQRSVVGPRDAVPAARFGDAFMVDTGVTLMPASLSQYSYGAASNGDGWRVMWANYNDYSVNTSSIGADGSLFCTNGGAIGHDANVSGGPTRSIVGTGSGFIAVWTSTLTPTAIWASRLDSAGVLVDSLPVFAGSGDQSWPSIVFDGDSTCLVVWQAANDIYAARVTTSGQVLDTNPIPVAQNPSLREVRPTAAVGQGIYLVAWTSYDSSNRTTAKARMVSAAGVLLDTAIFLRHTPDSTQAWPSVTFGDTCFLAAWSEGTGRPDVYAARVSVSGNLIDTTGIQLSGGTTNDMYPSVGFDGTRYLVVWEERVTSGFYKDSVCGRRMTVDGVPLDSGLIRLGPHGQSCTYPSVAADQANFLVAFCAYDTLTLDDNGCCTRVSPDGAVLDSGIFFPLGADAQEGPSGASDGTDFLAAWLEPQAEAVEAARISADGSVLDPVGFTVNDAPGSKSSLATGFGDSLYLVAWADYRSARGADIYCARVNLAVQVLDTRGIVVCEESLDQDNPDISFDGQNFLVVWTDSRSGTNGDIYAARVSPDGLVLDPDGFPVAADTFDDASPAVCFTGTDYLVVWQDGPLWQGKNDIYGALVSPAGVVTKPRFVVSGATNDQICPAVASGPTNSLVVWEDARGASSEIYAARILADGTVLDSNGLEVGVSGYYAHRPRVTSDEAGFRVLWRRFAPVTTTFSVGRVDTAGNVTHVGDWFGVPGSALAYDAVYGSGPELLLLYSVWADWESGRFFSSDRLWGRLGDVPGIEEAENRQLRGLTGGASVVRSVLWLPQASSRKPQAASLLDISGRKALDLKPGANDVSRLSPGVYFVREAQAQAQAQSVEKVIIAR